MWVSNFNIAPISLHDSHSAKLKLFNQSRVIGCLNPLSFRTLVSFFEQRPSKNLRRLNRIKHLASERRFDESFPHSFNRLDRRKSGLL